MDPVQFVNTVRKVPPLAATWRPTRANPCKYTRSWMGRKGSATPTPTRQCHQEQRHQTDFGGAPPLCGDQTATATA